MSINSIRRLLELASNQNPDDIVLIENEKKLTYRKLLSKVNQLANYFSQLDLKEGPRVGIYSRTQSKS